MTRDFLDAETRARIEERVLEIQEELRPLIDPIRESARLTEKDYMITINSPPVKYRDK